MTEAKMIASAQSCMSEPQELLHKLASNTGAKEHADHHRVQKVLDFGHAFVAITQGAVYAVIALRADGFMHSELSLHCFHLRHQRHRLGQLEALRHPAWLE